MSGYTWPTFLAPITKVARQIRERGVWGTVIQLYTVGDLKFGTLKGTDRFGNKYYEDLDQPFGQHRWVEYSNIHDFDATMIQPEWHGWMHHVFDETPDEFAGNFHISATTSVSNAIYSNHLGYVDESFQPTAQTDLSQYRQRGWKVGSRMTGPEDPDLFYKQPGHPLSPLADKGGRFKDRKEVMRQDD